MKARYRAALMAAAFVFLFPLSARSEIKAGSFEVGAFGGYNFFENSQNLEHRPVFGGRLGYNFTRNFGIEGGVEFINTRVFDMSKIGAKEGQYRSPMDNVNLIFYHIDAVYHFMPDGKFNPFVLAGFGGAHYSPRISTKDMAAFNVGVGAKYWLTDNIALRVDLRDYLVTEIIQETYHNVGITFGITFAFGGKARPAVAQVAKYEAKPAPQPVPEAKPEPKAAEPVVVLVPEPKAAEPVVILLSEPKVEEKVIVLVAQPKVEEKVIVLALEDIHFDFDKSSLTKEAQVILKKNIQILKENPKAKVRIAGYTSASGTVDYNQKLSERRAKAVKDYLVDEGIIAPFRLSQIGYGETRPAMYEAAPKDLYSVAAKANMRVLFEIIAE
jgi:OOP family OmpA-OmpF porin